MAMGAGDRSRAKPFDKHQVLRAHPFFRDLGDAIIERLAPRVITTKLKKGAVIFRKGDIGSKLYAVGTGAVRISTPSEEGKDAIFNLVVPGELFGEIAFLDGGQRTADAVAIDDCELMVIERRDFIPLNSGQSRSRYRVDQNTLRTHTKDERAGRRHRLSRPSQPSRQGYSCIYTGQPAPALLPAR